MLSVYLKPTNYCTVDCEHCYLPADVRANKFTMTEDTLRKTAKMVLELAQLEGHQGVHFTWHGGEPLMLSPEWFYRAGEILEEEIGKGYFTESLQTSLVPYKARWNNLIKDRFESCIGTSIDFTQRKIKGSNENYLDYFMRKVTLARESGMYVVPGMVPTKNEVEKAAWIVDWISDNGFSELNVERYSKIGTMQELDWPSNAHHSQFLINFFDRIMERFAKGEHTIQSNVTVAAILGILFKNPGDRWGTSCQKEFIVVEPDGALNTCPDRARHEKPFSYAQDGGAAFKQSQGRRKWIRIMDVTHKKDHCLSCDYRSWCKSGCPVTPNGPSDGQRECAGFKRYLDHVSAFISASEENKALVLEYAKPLGEQIVAPYNLLERDKKNG